MLFSYNPFQFNLFFFFKQVILSNYDLLYMDSGLGDIDGGPAWDGNYRTWLDLLNFNLSIGTN